MKLQHHRQTSWLGKVWLPLKFVEHVDKEIIHLPRMPVGFASLASSPPGAKFACFFAVSSQERTQAQLSSIYFGCSLNDLGPYGLIMADNGRVGVKEVPFKYLEGVRSGLKGLGSKLNLCGRPSLPMQKTTVKRKATP